MMKRILLTAAICLSAVLTCIGSSSAGQLYASGNAGIAFEPNRPNAIPFGLAIGDEFNKYLRAEIALDAYTMGANGTNLGTVTTFSFMPKAYVQYPLTLGTSFKTIPYLSAGFGLGSVSGSGATYSTTGLWAVGAGVMFPVSTNFQMGAGYEYVSSTSPVVQQPGYTDVFKANVFKLIGRFNF